MKNIDSSWHRQLTYDNSKFDVKYIPKDIFYVEITPKCNEYILARSWQDKNYYDKLYLNLKKIKVLIRNIKNAFYKV